MEEIKRSCIDCGVTNCRGVVDGLSYPPFCPTTQMNQDIKKEALDSYENETQEIMKAAALVEAEGYGKWCRVDETMEFARKMGYKKLGIATCAGLIDEARTLAKILRNNGFEVYGIACKAGAVPKVEVGIDPSCCSVGPNMCNPILQAKLLAEEGTELNLVVGLCVGHDSLFYRNSAAPATTVVVKDRVMGHNPVAALYSGYNRRKYKV